jgi:hypothetical protein
MSLNAFEFAAFFRGRNPINTHLEIGLCSYFKYLGLPVSCVRDFSTPNSTGLEPQGR